MGGCGRDINFSTILAYNCLGREKPSNNPVGTVGPTVEPETGLTPEHNSETELLEAAASAHCKGKCTLPLPQLFLAGDRGTTARAVKSVAMQKRCRPLYGE